jgi:hypothetical protein
LRDLAGCIEAHTLRWSRRPRIHVAVGDGWIDGWMDGWMDGNRRRLVRRRKSGVVESVR